MVKYYTGVGSRGTPPEVMKLISEIAFKLELDGYTLRSGGADGADSAFEEGCYKLKDIYIPWRGFMDRGSAIIPEKDRRSVYKKAEAIALEFHPNPEAIKGKPALKLHTRNVFQVLGDDLETPSDFVILWAPPYKDGVTGGTNMAYQIAAANDIEIFNLFDDKVKERFKKYVGWEK